MFTKYFIISQQKAIKIKLKNTKHVYNSQLTKYTCLTYNLVFLLFFFFFEFFFLLFGLLKHLTGKGVKLSHFPKGIL